MRLVIGEKPIPVRECLGRTSEASTRGWDLSGDLTAIGGSPGCGSFSKSGLFVPEFPTEDLHHRYLFLLCGVVVPPDYGIVVRGLRQAVLLRAMSLVTHSVSNESATDLLPLEREVESPFWSFPDGNVSWHLRFIGPGEGWPDRSDPDQLPSTSPTLCGVSPSLLYLPPLFPYRPPARGVPPGDSIGDWGTFHDIRFPWTSNDFQLAEYVRGPGRLLFFASVYQSCPTDRPNPNDIPGIRIEDTFVSQFPESAVYGRVAGSIIFQVVRDRECISEAC